MPPKKKRRSPRRPQSPAEALQSQSQSQSQSQLEHSASPQNERGSDREDSRSAAADDDELVPQIFNTTFSTYRVSPLHIGSQPLTASRLQTLSRRFRDVVVGDVVRGVQVGLGLESDATLGRAGALERVEWRWVPLDRLLGGKAQNSSREGSLELGSADVEPEGEERQRARRRGGGRGRHEKTRGAKELGKETGQREQNKALHLELNYENSIFSALLLPDISPASRNKETDISRLPWMSSTTAAGTAAADGQIDQLAFLHLPLLLFKLPAALKSILIDFLSSTFDCRVSPLRLGTQTLVRCWEDCLSHNTRSNSHHQQPHKDVTLTLGFHIEPVGTRDGQETEKTQETKEIPPQLGLKSLDVIIPADEVVRFLRAGEKIVSRTADLDKDDRQKTNQSANKRKVSDAFPLQRGGGDTENHRRLRRKLAGAREDEGWEWRRNSRSRTSNGDEDNDPEGGRNSQPRQQPFTEALASYLDAHLALDLFHPGVRIQRVTCAGFVMAETGRVRIARPRPNAITPHSSRDADRDGGSSAVWSLIQELVSKAKGREWSADAVRLARLVATEGNGGRG